MDGNIYTNNFNFSWPQMILKNKSKSPGPVNIKTLQERKKLCINSIFVLFFEQGAVYFYFAVGLQIM